MEFGFICAARSGDLTVAELVITWFFVAICVVYLFTFIYLIIFPSPLSDRRLLIVEAAVFSLGGSSLILLKYFDKINEYFLLGFALLYIACYALGIFVHLRLKRKFDLETKALLETQALKLAEKNSETADKK